MCKTKGRVLFLFNFCAVTLLLGGLWWALRADAPAGTRAGQGGTSNPSNIQCVMDKSILTRMRRASLQDFPPFLFC